MPKRARTGSPPNDLGDGRRDLLGCAAPNDRLLRLSPRERQVVDLLLEEDSDKGIAARLGLSVHTVHSHVQRIYRKIGVRSRTQLVVRVHVERRQLDA